MVMQSIFLKRKAHKEELYTRPRKMARLHEKTDNLEVTPQLKLPSEAAHNQHVPSLGLLDTTHAYDISEQSPLGRENTPFSETEAPPVSDSDCSDSDDDKIDSLFGDGDQAANESDSSQNFDETLPAHDDTPFSKKDPGSDTLSIPERRPGPPLVDSLKVTRWVEFLDQFASLRIADNLHPKLANNLHALLQHINEHKDNAYLTPQVLLETQLAKIIKQFRHSQYERQTRRVADEVTKYWRKLCLDS